MMKFFAIVFLLSANLVHAASTTDDIRYNLDYINVAFDDGKKIIKKKISYDELNNKNYLNIILPHLSINPKQEKSAWAGVKLRDVLNNSKYAFDQNSDITIVGSDEYLSQKDVFDVLNTDIIIARYENGQKISRYKGGQQVIMPDEYSPDDPRLRHHAFWIWYVNTIFFDTLRPIVTLSDGQNRQTINLTEKFSGLSSENIVFPTFPPGVRKEFEFENVNQITVTSIKLSVLIKSETNFSSPITVAESYLGNKVVINEGFENYLLIYKWNGRNIHPKYGGPVQLCHQEKILTCLHFVESVEIINSSEKK